MKITHALVVKLSSTKGLKILALLGVPVRVWPRAPLMNKIISDTNSKSKKLNPFIKNIKKKLKLK